MKYKFGYGTHSMGVVYGVNDYEATTFMLSSRDEMLSLLNANFENRVILEEPEFVSKYTIISIQKSGAHWRLGIGIAYSETGIQPRIISLPYENGFILWYNQTLVLMDIVSGSVVWLKKFCTDIVFCKCRPDGCFVLCEDCIYSLSYKGDVKNTYLLDDQLDEFEFSANTLFFTTCSSSEKQAIILSEFVCKCN